MNTGGIYGNAIHQRIRFWPDLGRVGFGSGFRAPLGKWLRFHISPHEARYFPLPVDPAEPDEPVKMLLRRFFRSRQRFASLAADFLGGWKVHIAFEITPSAQPAAGCRA